jgi:hypothetical protein
MTASWQRTRARPAPPGAEHVAVIILGAVACLALAPLATQGLVLLVRTGDFAWPSDPVAALLGLAHGDLGVGLSPAQAHRLPGPKVLVALTVVGEILALTAMAACARTFIRTTGADGKPGLARPRDAVQALGVRALRQRAPVIRPDLRRPARHRGSQE